MRDVPRPGIPVPVRSPLAALAGLIAVSCGASDVQAPPYADPGPACPKMEQRLSGLLAAVNAGGTAKLRASLEAGLDDHTAGRLVEVVSAVLRALPQDISLPDVQLPSGLLGAVVRGLADSPDLQALGEVIGPVLADCNLAPMIRVGAAMLRDPRLPGVIDAVVQSASDVEAIATFRAAILTTPGQRSGWPHLAVPLVCLLRNTDDDLVALRQFLVPLLGERAEAPPLSTAVDGLIDLLAPGTAARGHAAQWVGCYVGRAPGPDAFSCPYPLPELSPDPDGVIIRVLWDVLSAATAPAAPGSGPVADQPATPIDPALLKTVADAFDRLADEPHLAQAWSDVLSALLAAPGAADGLRELATLLEQGAADELLDAFGAAAQGCEQ